MTRLIKSLALAAATAIGLSTFADAAVYHHYRGAHAMIYHGAYGAGAGTGAAAHFQDQFRNTY